MSVQELRPEDELSHDALVKARIDFAEKCFSNSQDLSRTMDMKANYLVQAVALLTAALGIVASKALDVTPADGWTLWLKGAAFVAFLAYIVLAFLVIYNVTKVFRALPNLLPSHSEAPGLIFPLVVLSRFGTPDAMADEAYFEKMSAVTPSEILHDFANQIFEISAIYERKQRYINLAMRLFAALTICWIIAMLAILATILFK